jgi:hypothetical protein
MDVLSISFYSIFIELIVNYVEIWLRRLLRLLLFTFWCMVYS